uniref:Uncharacterized protein n=1 Tax=Rhizophora mucronata TaxID=61149 RepID=A0A2P2NAA2_RHIMU
MGALLYYLVVAMLRIVYKLAIDQQRKGHMTQTYMQWNQSITQVAMFSKLNCMLSQNN